MGAHGRRPYCRPGTRPVSAGAEPAATSAAATTAGEAAARTGLARRRERAGDAGADVTHAPDAVEAVEAVAVADVPDGEARIVGDLRHLERDVVHQVARHAERQRVDEEALPQDQVADRRLVELGEVLE